LSTAFNALRRGAFKSSDSPVYEIKMVGITRQSSTMKAGDVGSHAV
jgi:hypothetical protein